MADTTELVPELLEAGVHFGHQTKRWNPKMRPYIFEQRNQIYIINLDETVQQLQRATQFFEEITAARREDFVCRVQETGAAGSERSGPGLRSVFRQPTLAWRHA